MVQRKRQTGETLLRTATTSSKLTVTPAERIKALETIIATQQVEIKKLRSQTYLDELVPLGNRRKFDEDTAMEISTAIRSGTTLSIIVFDIAELKKTNDTKGLQEGDKLLIAVASVLNSSCNRESDTAYRWGGDEFAVILPATKNTGAHIFAKRVKKLAAQAGIQLYSGIGTYIPSAYPEGRKVSPQVVELAIITEAAGHLNFEKNESKYSRMIRTDKDAVRRATDHIISKLIGHKQSA
jgi:diguanylate cyclase (GGDEF)-like protein